jgi:hypothetical protein
VLIRQAEGTMDSLPIGDYALLSDCGTAALVSREGSVDWLCFPRFDAPSVFCRLLDPAAGHFAIRPAGEFQASRRYVDQTMVLETTFTTAGGTAVLTDALTVGRNERGHDLGEHSPSMLARWLACTDGEIEAEVVYAPRPQYRDIRPRLVPVAGGITAWGGADPLLLVTSVVFGVEGAIATARIRLAAGQAAVFVVAHGMAAPPQRSKEWRAASLAGSRRGPQTGRLNGSRHSRPGTGRDQVARRMRCPRVRGCGAGRCSAATAGFPFAAHEHAEAELAAGTARPDNHARRNQPHALGQAQRHPGFPLPEDLHRANQAVHTAGRPRSPRSSPPRQGPEPD